MTPTFPIEFSSELLVGGSKKLFISFRTCYCSLLNTSQNIYMSALRRRDGSKLTREHTEMLKLYKLPLTSPFERSLVAFRRAATLQ